jgi:hypothetical protein
LKGCKNSIDIFLDERLYMFLSNYTNYLCILSRFTHSIALLPLQIVTTCSGRKI